MTNLYSCIIGGYLKDSRLILYKTILILKTESVKSAKSVVSVFLGCGSAALWSLWQNPFFAKQTQFLNQPNRRKSLSPNASVLKPQGFCRKKQTQFGPKQTQSPKNPRNPWFHLFSQNKPNFRLCKIAVSPYLLKTQVSSLKSSFGKIKPNQSRSKPIRTNR
jgi:hypothetical protein